MSNPAKALFTLLLVMVAVVFIIYCSGSFVTDTQKDSYEEALQSATQTATLAMIDTSNVNNLYDGGRRESGDIPIDHSSLDYFRENLAQILYSGKSGTLGSVSNINIPLVGYISYDYIFGVTYGEAYSSVKSLANQNKTVSEYLSTDIASRDNTSKRGTYLLPMGYVHPISNLTDLGITSVVGNNTALMCFTLGDVLHIRRNIENVLEFINNDGDEQYKNIDNQYIIYTSGCELCGDKEISDCYIHRIDGNNGKLWHDDTDTEMPDAISIENFVRDIGFYNIYQLRDYIVMNTINTYLSQYSGRGFSATADNISTSLNISLSLSDKSVDNEAYTENSTVIDGPGVFAIIDLYKGSKDEKQTVQRLASFGSSELKRVTNSSDRGTSSGGIDGSTPGGPGSPGGPGGSGGNNPGMTTTVNIKLHPNGGSGEVKEMSVVLTNGQSTIKTPNNTFLPPAGKIFKCWEDSITHKQYYPNSIITVTGEMNLLAQWETDIENNYIIEYYNDGELYGKPIPIPKGTEFIIQNLNSSAETPFLGWAITPDSTTVLYKGGELCKPSSDMKLYAVYDDGKEVVISAPEVYNVYDGKAHEVNAKVNMSNFDISVEYTDNAGNKIEKPIDAGTYRATVTATNGIERHVAVTTVTIDKRALEITTSNSSKVYDGRPLTASGTYTGLVDGETITFTVTGRQTEIGKSDNTYNIEWNGTAKRQNYDLVENLGILEVFEDYYTQVKITTHVTGISQDKLPDYRLSITYTDENGNESGELVSRSDAILEQTNNGFDLIFNITLEKNIEFLIKQLGLSISGYDVESTALYDKFNSSINTEIDIHIDYTEIQKDKAEVSILPWIDYNEANAGEFAFYICIDNNTDSELQGKLNLVLYSDTLELIRIDEVKGSEGSYSNNNSEHNVRIRPQLAGNNYEVLLMAYTRVKNTDGGEVYVTLTDTADNVQYISNNITVNGGIRYNMTAEVLSISDNYINVRPKADSDSFASFNDNVQIDVIGIDVESLNLNVGDTVKIVYTDIIGTNTGIDMLYNIVSIVKT